MKEAGDETLAFESLFQQSKLIFSKLVMISFSPELLALLVLVELMSVGYEFFKGGGGGAGL